MLVIAALAWASTLGNPRYPQDDFNGVMRQAILLIPITLGTMLISWGAKLGGTYGISLELVLAGFAVALWGPEWGCVPCHPR